MIRTVKDYERLSEQYNKMLEERNSLIDDLPWYRAKVSRLEREKEEIKESHIKHITNMENYYKDRLQKLKQENKTLRLQSDTYFEQWQQHKALNNEISQHIGNKPSSSTYKYFRAKLNGLGIEEGE